MAQTDSGKVQEFLRSFMFDGGLLQIAVGDVDNSHYFPQAPKFTSVPEDKDVYFSPAIRRVEGGKKSDVLGSVYLWVDVDDPVLPDCTFPPSAVVFSGNGNHLYWRLDQPCLEPPYVEELNKILIGDIPVADTACWNSNRLMRVPGTMNVHRPERTPRRAELHIYEPWTYATEDIEVLGRLEERTRYVIRSGDQSEWKSRSERDYYVINELVTANASDTLITFLFAHQPVGDKYRENDNGPKYLKYTIDKAREEREKANENAEPGDIKEIKAAKQRRRGGAVPTQIVERSDGYYVSGATLRQISTFKLVPQVLLRGAGFDAHDALVCNVLADGQVWSDVTFPKSAFETLAAINKVLPVAEWSWLGNEGDVRNLWKYLMEKLKDLGNRKVSATPVLGLHQVDNQWLFLGHDCTLSSEARFCGVDGPLTWLPLRREHAKSNFAAELGSNELRTVVSTLPLLNEPAPLWTLIGWYTAALVKPWLELNNYRFPVLNVTGTRGSGKTTLIKNVMLPLFSGQPDANIYDAGTTRFVKLALLASSNAVPLAFGEFRYESVEQFIRTILLSYDTGHDPRGRSDQTTTDWPLTAPYSIDGEDVIQDAAARERILIARLKPETIDEGAAAWKAYKDFVDHIPAGFAPWFIQRVLLALANGKALELLKEAKADMFAGFPSKLPDRVRANYSVALFGIRLYGHICDTQVPEANVFTPSITEVVNLDNGRSRTLIDDFVESLINHGAQHGHKSFAWHYDIHAKEFWCQMSSAHSWWLMQRKRQGAGTLQIDALKAQLREAPYFVGLGNKDSKAMYGVSITKAIVAGLDVPAKMGDHTVTIEW